MADETLYRASHRYARISAQKARLVMDQIRNKPVEDALMTLRFSQRRASPMISKVLRSAMANATQEAGVESEDLVVWRAFVDEGPTAKRWRPRSMGRAYPRLRRSCHLSVVLKQVEKAKDRKKGAPVEGKPESDEE
jgi:large subunit ribosomal protein L22